ncbi:hypothetical protein WR25_07434 [Diploscapter pachys]|uniref:Major facilitator superfamily (MFS) profile domain-containing protein n=1 Tax=Diploscapter pachys TaxID=2018661 RepID=A0A2A2JT94_9BILA|nr:hypothetical protein WR25_07434 [Diploscapter pachys]
MNSTEVDAVEEVITEEELEKVSIDDFIKIGPHCYLILIFAEFILLAAAGNMMYMMYAGAAPYSVPCVGKNFTIPDICAPEYSNASLEDCEIQPKYDFKSVNIEFKLFCKNGQLVKSSVSYQMMGVMFGTLLTGQLSDRFGRIKIIHVCMVIVTVISYATTFTTNLFEFTLIRTLLGVFNGGLIGFVRESPRWLVQRGRIEEARVIMNRMLKMDGASEKKKRLMNKQHSQGGKSYNVLKLFSNRGMSIAISVMCLGRFFTSLINYGLIFNIEKISGSLFVNALITGFLRWTINIIFAILDFKLKIFGRKVVHFGAQFCIAICMFSMAVSYLLGK